MDDFLLALITAILDIFAEALLEIGSGFLVSLLERAGRKLLSTPARRDRFFSAFLFVVFGASAGFVSVALFPHPLVHPSRFHGISLLISPIITGLVMFGTGRIELKLGRKPTQIETFWIGFVFAFALAIVRFVLVK
jgi:hypothetical protein